MPSDVTIACADGYRLVARLFMPPQGVTTEAGVLIAPATGVQARYYWRYAAHLAKQGLEVVVPDYRGIGRSAPQGGARSLRRLRVRWHEWGSLDLEACILWMRERMPHTRLCLVGHSFGGVAALFAAHAGELERMLLIGAQHAYWRDYEHRRRLSMLWRWHLVMPALTLLTGYFPGRRLGWLEDLPRRVAWDWALGRADYVRRVRRADARASDAAAALTSAVLLVSPTDDPFATSAASRRMISYVPSAQVCEWRVSPEDLDSTRIGHFGLFREGFEPTFWSRSARWLAGTSDETLPATC